jgi:hypothetical protein
MSIPRKDAELVPYMANFSGVLAANPTTYLQTPGVATAVAAAYDAYLVAYNTMMSARANGTRSEQMTATRTDTRSAMLDVVRPIYVAVQAAPAISDTEKIALGVHVRDANPSRASIPDFAPVLTVTKIDGAVVTFAIRDPNNPDRKAKPDGVTGITYFSYVGQTPPSSASAFKFEGNTGQTTVRIDFGSSVATGARVWLSASYFNNRKQSGPASSPIGAIIGAGSTMPTLLKIAA